MKKILLLPLLVSALNAETFEGEGTTGLNNYKVKIEIGDMTEEDIKISGFVFWEKGKLAEFEGKGSTLTNNTIKFSFKDTFGNKGDAQIFRVKKNDDTKGDKPYVVKFNIGTVVEPSVARQFYEYYVYLKDNTKK